MICIIVKQEGGWTLSKVSKLLEEPQHRLIHLCEKGVVRPDLEEARGRGSSRRFSERNLLQFAVALKLRQLMVPVGPIAAVVDLLDAFERVLARELPGFRLPSSLTDSVAPEVRVIISDDRRLFFALHPRRGAAKLFGGIELDRFAGESESGRRPGQKIGPVRPGAAAPAVTFGAKGAGERGRIEVSVTGLAKDIRKRLA